MEKANFLERIRDQFFDIRRREWPSVLLMSLFFFMVIATFWVLKPMKRGLLVNFYQEAPLLLFGTTFTGAEVEQLAKVVNMIVVYAVVILFTYLSRKVERQHINLIFCLIFAALFVLFANLINTPGAGTAWSFYVLGDMFNSVMVIFFWAFANDIFNPDQAKRTYGIVGLGGIIGGIVGASLVAGFVDQIGRASLLYLCLIPILLIIGIVYLVNSWNRDNTDEKLSANKKTSGNAAIEGARLVFSSKYLLAIVGIIGLYEMVSNIVDFQLSATIASEITGDLEKDVYFGYVGQITNVLSLLVQLFLTSFVMKKYGVGVALLFLPIAITLGSIGFLIIPSLAFVTLMSASDNSLNYSINQSAKEALYTPTTREQKYKAKAFIDMFVQRGAKVLAVVLNLAVAAYVGIEHVRLLSIVCLLILSFWIAIVRYAGQEFKKKTEF